MSTFEEYWQNHIQLKAKIWSSVRSGIRKMLALLMEHHSVANAIDLVRKKPDIHLKPLEKLGFKYSIKGNILMLERAQEPNALTIMLAIGKKSLAFFKMELKDAQGNSLSLNRENLKYCGQASGDMEKLEIKEKLAETLINIMNELPNNLKEILKKETIIKEPGIVNKNNLPR